jgi:hypothetical protein
MNTYNYSYRINSEFAYIHYCSSLNAQESLK